MHNKATTTHPAIVVVRKTLNSWKRKYFVTTPNSTSELEGTPSNRVSAARIIGRMAMNTARTMVGSKPWQNRPVGNKQGRERTTQCKEMGTARVRHSHQLSSTGEAEQSRAEHTTPHSKRLQSSE